MIDARYYLLIGAALLSAAVSSRNAGFQVQSPSAPAPQPSRARIALTQTLPRLDGDRLQVRLVEVIYEPGGANASHRHPCPVVGYVLEGALRMQIDGRPETIYKTGDVFYESPDDVHVVSSNASARDRARFLAYFTCDRDGAQLSVPTVRTRGD